MNGTTPPGGIISDAILLGRDRSRRRAGVVPASSERASVRHVGWTRAAEAFRVVGPVHYVGTEDLGVFLLTSPKGHVLVDGALGESAPLIEQSIRSLGFDPKDIKVLVTTQAHCDHVGSRGAFQAHDRSAGGGDGRRRGGAPERRKDRSPPW